jgi:nucleoside-diphosphate-sugar epimerase
MKTILVTGSRGQIGSDLVAVLRRRYGRTQIIESVRETAPHVEGNSLPDEVLDVTDKQRLQEIVEQYQIDTIYHLAGLLSAKGEQNPELCWNANVNGLKNVLEAAKSYGLKVFWPSSIAVFGPHTPKLDTPQITVEDPSTMYGITKVTGSCYVTTTPIDSESMYAASAYQELSATALLPEAVRPILRSKSSMQSSSTAVTLALFVRRLVSP